MRWALPWICVFAASVTLGCALTSALTSVAPDSRIVLTAGSQDTGPACTWIGAYCAFPDR